MAHQLVRLLGGGIERYRRVGAVLDRERQLGVAAIDRARAGIDQVLEIGQMPAQLQHGHVADQVGPHIGERMIQRIAHPRLRRQVNHVPQTADPCHFAQHAVVVGDVQPVEAEAGLFGQPRQPRLLERNVVIVVEVVDADDLFAARKQRLSDVITDEAGGAGHEEAHQRP